MARGFRPLKHTIRSLEPNTLVVEDRQRIILAEGSAQVWDDARDNWEEWADKRTPRKRPGIPRSWFSNGAKVAGDIFFEAIGAVSAALAPSGGNVVHPATVSAGAMLLLFGFSAVSDSSGTGGTFDTPSGWTLRGVFGTYDPFGLGAQYSADLHVFSKEATGTEDSTNLVVSGTGNYIYGQIASYTKSAGIWNVSSAFGGQMSVGNPNTPYAVASADPGLTSKDVIVAFAESYDTGVGYTAYSAQAFSASGATFSGTTERSDQNAFPSLMWVDAQVSGNAIAAPRLDTNVGNGVEAGGVVFVRLRAE